MLRGMRRMKRSMRLQLMNVIGRSVKNFFPFLPMALKCSLAGSQEMFQKRTLEIFVNQLVKFVSLSKLLLVRLVKDKNTGENKGYAFVTFQAIDIAQKAIEELKSKEFKGKSLRCSLSESKLRLFVGNIPKAWSDEQFKQVIHDVGPGAETIDLKQDRSNPGRNRGFAFIEYYNNACADYARLKMSDGTFKLEGNAPTVTWADPKTAPKNSAAASQVKC